MRRKAFTLVEVLVVVAVLVILASIIVGAVKSVKDGATVAVEETTSINNGRGWGSTIRTVSHDGHRFVTMTANDPDGGVAIIHHPDCPCLVVTLGEIE